MMFGRRPARARSVRATLNYTVDNGIAPDYYFYEPDPSVKLNPPGTDAREVEIHDGWPVVEQLSVDREGFELHPFGARFDGFDADDTIKSEFYPQVVEFVKRHTGASRVEVFDHTIRKRLSRGPEDADRGAASGRAARAQRLHGEERPQRVRDVVPDDAEALLKRRVALMAFF